MSLPTGTRLGVYEVVGKIGAGGMGEVYRARDTRLDRDVALKVLPELFTSDPDRLARFEREAKVLASLNHPNIAQVYGFEAAAAGSGQGSAIAMELVEGPTLDDARRDAMHAQGAGFAALPWALPIVRQIAQALEAAHDQGIVHRDLKPGNVKLREDGTVKVLDFGLAKVWANDADSSMSVANSPTLTARATQLGMILGTAAYMAPEQAKGRSVDRRADVWAFGAVFFELLAGRRAFEGDDVSEVLASVLKTEPDWSALPADLPAPVLRLLKRCLDKDPKKRLRDVGEGMLQLDDSLAGNVRDRETRSSVEASGSSLPPPMWRRALPVAAAIGATALFAYVLHVGALPTAAVPPVVKFTIDTAPARVNYSGTRSDLAISPNGQYVVYVVVMQTAPTLMVRRLDQLGATPVRGGEIAGGPFFSADSASIGFISSDDQRTLKRVPVSGGPATLICRATGLITGATWATDGTIVFGIQGNGLWRVAEGGGTPVQLTELDKTSQENDHVWPSMVPGTSLLLFVTNTGVGARRGKLAILDLRTGKVVRLPITGTYPRFVSSGHIVYAIDDGSLRAVRFDPATLAASGNSAPVLESVGVKPTGASNFDISADGHLAYLALGGQAGTRGVVWVDRAGTETAIPVPQRNYYYTRLSPDGRYLSLDVRDQEEDIWIWDLTRDSMSRLTDKPGADQYGLWAPDGRVVFSSATLDRQEVFIHRADGVGQPAVLTDTAGGALTPFPNAISPDGRQLILRSQVNGKNDLFVVDIGGDPKPRRLIGTEHNELNAAFSPDGKFIVFESDQSGRPEVYARPYPDVESRQLPVSTAGGSKAVWSPTGREIFYLAPDGKMMAVAVIAGPEVAFGKPALLFDAANFYFGGQGRNYDVTRDGKRFVMVRFPPAGAAADANPITVVLNWATELSERLK